MTASGARRIPVVALLVLGIACSAQSRPVATPTTAPSRSSTRTAKEKGLCQPFPDRLVDDFTSAYNDRDLDALEELVEAEPITDVVTAASAGTATFDDVRRWAEAGWNVGDRMRQTGYSAFYPTKRGFQMFMTRRSALLEDHRIEQVTTTLDAISRGCWIISLEMSGEVQAKGSPCAFYEAFGTVADVAANEPEACRDGSGDHARSDPAAVWTGEEVLLWGGSRGGYFPRGDVAMDGLSFETATGRWERIREPPLPPFLPEITAWTGRELVVFGGKIWGRGVVGAGYEPGSSSWRAIEFPYRRWTGFEGVWTGTELVVWGGPGHSERPRRRGAAYDPATDSWRKTSPAPIGGRWGHWVVWTGMEMVVWGGTNNRTDLADGAAYDPATDTWRRIAASPLSARRRFPMAWAGREVVVWGGSSFSSNRADGAAYDPVSDSWRMLPPAPLRGRHYHSATWAGSEVIVFGGYNYDRSFRAGAAYDPVSNSWRRLSRPAIAPRFLQAAVWTGAEMFVFGGTESFDHIALGDGALYDPATDRWRRVIPTTRN